MKVSVYHLYRADVGLISYRLILKSEKSVYDCKWKYTTLFTLFFTPYPSLYPVMARITLIHKKVYLLMDHSTGSSQFEQCGSNT